MFKSLWDVNQLGALPRDPVPLLGSLLQPQQEQKSVRASTHPGIQYCYWHLDTSSHRSDREYAQARTQGSSTVTGIPT